MFRRLLVLAAATALIPSEALLAQVPPPRDTVRAVADRIEKIYFDEAKAKAIAADLRAEADKGAYDRHQRPDDLAIALTAKLKPLDRHFGVSWIGNANPSGASQGPRPDPQVAARRSGYGFRRVEVLPGNVGYIDLRSFMPIKWEDPNWPVRKAADAALTLVSGASAVIIDLRDNGGGSPAMVGYLTSAFTPAGADIYNTFYAREGQQSERPEVAYSAPMLDVPLYILTSGRTGSAAEALAYTLQAAGRATIVGEASGGAANPGGTVPTETGFAVFISDASPRNPITKSNWEATGVKPNVETPAGKALDRARQIALETVLLKLPENERQDTQWALDALRAAPSAAGRNLDQYAGDYGNMAVTVGANGLEAQQERRPALRLLPLGTDLFYVEHDPSRRFFFERDAQGKVVAIEARTSAGQSLRRPRA